MTTVEAVVINWKRPGNIPRILEALRAQTVKCKVTLIDIGGKLRPATYRLADEVLRWRVNLGGFNRFVPSNSYLCEYTYFHDDDMLPGRRALASFLRHAAALDFAVLGQVGRRFAIAGAYLPFDEVLEVQDPTKVDLVVRGYFVRTNNLKWLSFLASQVSLDEMRFNDDLLLKFALEAGTGLESWVVPIAHIEESIRLQELPHHDAISNRPEHYPMRDGLMKKLPSLVRQITCYRRAVECE